MHPLTRHACSEHGGLLLAGPPVVPGWEPEVPFETGEERGWLRGLSDPYVATALTAVHDKLAAPWTIQSLAEAAGPNPLCST